MERGGNGEERRKERRAGEGAGTWVGGEGGEGALSIQLLPHHPKQIQSM
jgi:hypothetical protein